MKKFDPLAAFELITPLLTPYTELTEEGIEQYAQCVYNAMGEHGFARRPFHVPRVVTWKQEMGFYCPDNRTIVLAVDDKFCTLAHELCHAFQPCCHPGMAVSYIDDHLQVDRDLYLDCQMEEEAFLIQMGMQLLTAFVRHPTPAEVRAEWVATKATMVATLPAKIAGGSNPMMDALEATSVDCA